MSTLKTVLALVALLAANPVTTLAGQDALLEVKALYAAAAYEEALAVISRVPAEPKVAELDQLRAFCLIALGNHEQARDVIEKILMQNPLFEPGAGEMSPRVLEEFRQVGARVIPGVARRMYTDAKAALDRKDRGAAVSGFETVIRIGSAYDAADPALADLKLLAEGFIELSRLLPDASATPLPTPAPAAAPGAAPSGAPVFERPVAVTQVMPPWRAPNWVGRDTVFEGAIRVLVGIDGGVTSVEIIRSIHPLYDRLLVEAAKDWRYKPALRGGQPIASEVVVQVRLGQEN